MEVLGDGDGPVTGLRVERNRLDPDPRGGARAVATGEHEVIPCGLVIRSIGYRGRPLPGVPFEERRGLIRNAGGRVCDEDGAPRPGEYAVGWIKRGPSGVIGTNKKCATDTVGALLEDLARGRLPETASGRPRGVAAGAGAGARHVARLGGDRRARARSRGSGRPPARQARAGPGDDRRGRCERRRLCPSVTETELTWATARDRTLRAALDTARRSQYDLTSVQLTAMGVQMTGKRNVVTDRRTRPIGEHAYVLPVVREIPPDPPDPVRAGSLW